MRLLAGLLLFLYNILVAYTLLVYALTYWTPSSHWIAGFMMMSLPVLVAVHLVFLIFRLVVSPKRAVVPLLVLLAGLPFLERTFQLNHSAGGSWAAAPEQRAHDNLTILNYNVFSFGIYDYTQEKDKSRNRQFNAWITRQEADVLCFQEYFSHGTVDGFNFTRLLGRKGYRHQAFLPEKKRGSNNESGMAIFSKHPILAVRDTLFSGQNGLLQADIVWKKDTIRIINVHLFSMTLQLSQVVAGQDYEKRKQEAKYAFRQMRRGFERRAEEVGTLESWIVASPHPILVCGDFNDTPYSYVYGRVRRHLANAFEEGGKGFGFTYHYLPSFIRIDNQFYSKGRLNLTSFKTLDSVPYSDHYPLIGSYSIN